MEQIRNLEYRPTMKYFIQKYVGCMEQDLSCTVKAFLIEHGLC